MNISKWTDDIDRITTSFRTEFGSLSADQLNAKPSPRAWSIAQNIDHLIVINQTYYPLLKAVRDGTYQRPWIGNMGFMVRLFGKMILDSVHPDRRKKMRTFPLWEPSKSAIGTDVIARFEKHQEELKQVIRESSDLLDRDTVISSPANRNIVYKLETAFDIIVTHEKRHLEQAREVLTLTAKV